MAQQTDSSHNNIDNHAVTAGLPDAIRVLLTSPTNRHNIYLCVRSEQAGQRQGTHKVRSRAEVSGSGRKPWPQKKTGRARAGSRRSPIFTGGGIVFGPTPNRNYRLAVPKRVRLNAYHSIMRILDERGLVYTIDFTDHLTQHPRPSTAAMLTFLRKASLSLPPTSCVIITNNEVVYHSLRNVPCMHIQRPVAATVSLLNRARLLIIDQDALDEFATRFTLAVKPHQRARLTLSQGEEA